MKPNFLLPAFLLLSSVCMGQNGGSLFFSEYLEGTGNNKALEIFNPLDNSVDLSDYRIIWSVNGGPWESSCKSFPTNTFIPSGSTWTIINSQFNVPGISLDIANDQDIPPFNGNDAIGLIKISGEDTLLIDIIGVPGFDTGSGWDVAGVFSATANHTLIRKSSITGGNNDWDLSGGTNTDNSEWIIKDIDFADSLGHHYFKPNILISNIHINLSGQPIITIDHGKLTASAEILPLNATFKTLIWTSSQPLVASVNQSGLIVAFNDGSTWIKAATTDGSELADSVLITTSNQSGTLPVNSIVLSSFNGQDTIRLNHESLQMIATIKPENATNKNIEWFIDNPTLATLTQDGLLTAIKNGKVTVTARSTDGSEISGSKQIVITGQFLATNSVSQLRLSFNADNTAYRISTEVILTQKSFNRNTKYVQDETGGIQIDDPFGKISSEYNIGDGITGITGYLEENYGMLVFHPLEDPGQPTSTANDLVPELISAADFNNNFDKYESKLVKVFGLHFLQAGGTFLQLTNYTVQWGSEITVVRTEFPNADYLNTKIPNSANVTGIAIRLNTTPKLAPRSLEDFQFDPVSVENSNGISDLSVYPNPFNDEIRINSSEEIQKIEIRDVTGRVVLTRDRVSSPGIINTEKLLAGTYIMTIKSNIKSINLKLIKQ